MTFQEILPKFLEGEKIRRKYWDDDSFILLSDCALANSKVIVNNCDGIHFLVGDELIADDWEMYKEIKYFNFNTAVKLMEEGKCVGRKSTGCFGNIYLDKNKKIFKRQNGGTYCIDYDDYNAIDWYVVE